LLQASFSLFHNRINTFLTMASLKTVTRRSTLSGRTYRSVDEMLRGHGYRRVADAVRQLSAKTRLIDQLILARVAAGLTQAQLAAKLRCSQSRISKIEDSHDADLCLGDIQAYARIVGLKLQLDLR
jgi:ribosome-binding protein aMBF1 (putative translation factor)